MNGQFGRRDPQGMVYIAFQPARIDRRFGLSPKDHATLWAPQS
jgi:hypothetical protein